MKEKKIIRCAIYTRKSTEEGLDKDYNTLDAQREAGEKYIEAMKHEGWRIIPETYDDGGYSGGNMDRPALKKLISDIEAGRIDIVVVYKVDRLTRSLADFAKLVEVFDSHGTSFVSVTQHFNTQDSMGRLTLNILLSFAQFEREVTGERIRDKFASSKRKGMWMGGPPPLGYDVIDRMLIVNPKETELVNHIFNRFICLGSLSLLTKELNNKGYRTKCYISQTSSKQQGGNYFTVNNLSTVLRNRLYVGEIHHNGKYYQGQHKGIIPYELFEKAQGLIKENPTIKRKRTLQIKSDALLKGLIYCGTCGGAMSPTYTHKGNKKYRYYVGNSYRRHSCEACSKYRISAGEIEEVVASQIKSIFSTPTQSSAITSAVKKLNKNISEQKIWDALKNMDSLWKVMVPAEQKKIINMLIRHIAVNANGLDIEYRAEGIEELIDGLQRGVNE